MKYKLIKEYPGSPKLGVIAELYENHHYVVPHPKGKEYCDGLAINKKHVEENSEYWEEVNNVWYVILLRDGAFRNAWEVIKVNENPDGLEHKKYFKTKEEAEEFIFYNKPCLSYNDVRKNIHVGFSTERILRGINKTLKERL